MPRTTSKAIHWTEPRITTTPFPLVYEVPVLVDGDFRGRQRKMLMQASRNGYFFVLDRVDGKNLLTTPFGPVNWSLGIDGHGSPIPNPDKEATLDGRLVAPDENGLTNFRSPSFDAKTGLLIVDSHPSYSLFYFSKSADGAHAWTGDNYDIWGERDFRGLSCRRGGELAVIDPLAE
jgi:alcohol dehydrogenase (cytochrome c)